MLISASTLLDIEVNMKNQGFKRNADKGIFNKGRFL